MPPFDEPDTLGPDQHLPDDLPPDPFPILASWLDEAFARKIQPNPNAMALATVAPDGRPSVRIVLCKGLNPAPGYVVFYTNYNSRKSRELDANPQAAAVFFWDSLDRQARIEGPIVRSPPAESDAYFASRPLESRIGAWSSDQSEPIASRKAMAQRVAAAMQRFGIDPAALASARTPIPRPPHWGGYRLYAQRIELWVSGAGRIHDRAAWSRTLTPAPSGFALGPWTSTRLQP